MQANERQREAVMMRLDGYTYEEIGNRLGVTKQWAEQLCKNAIQGKSCAGMKIRRPCVYPKIAEYMERNRCSYTDIARTCGATYQTVKTFLSGKTKDIRLSTALKIAAMLGMTVEEAFVRD